MRKVAISTFPRAPLYRTHGAWDVGEVFHNFTDSLFGTGVFNADGKFPAVLYQVFEPRPTVLYVGDLWKFHRSMSRPFFSRERISHFDLFDRHAGALPLATLSLPPNKLKAY